VSCSRALGDDVLPPGLNGDPNGYPIGKGADLFISMWNLHRCALQSAGIAAFFTETRQHTMPYYDVAQLDTLRQPSWGVCT